jgi:glucose-6-phosphate isomerase
MKKENNSDFVFENKILAYRSYISGFTPNIYEDFESLSEKIDLKSKIEDLFKGKKVNKSENLAALHTKCREDFLKEKQQPKYFHLFKSAKNVINIGIGGSYEGPKLLIESYGNCRANHIFITGSDHEEFYEKTVSLKPNETIFVVSSKSFITDETISLLKAAIDWSGDLDRFIAITANKNEALKYNLKNIIEFDKEIGGRYSIWSDISLVAHWENNVELKEKFILGGRHADDHLKNNKDYFKFLKRLAYSDIWLNNYKNKSSRVILSYIWKFRSFSDYVQQLEMESLGKQPSKDSKFKKTGQLIFGGYGPTAQHSYFQLLHQGTQDICADIIVSKEDQNNLAYAQGVTQSKLLSIGAKDFLNDEELINGNTPLNLFILNKVDSFTLGYLIATWEHRTYITSVMLGINAFDQFGVNAGKIYTKRYLANKV